MKLLNRALSFSAIFVLGMVGVALMSPQAEGFFSKHKLVKDVAGEVRISVADVKDGEAHYFRYAGEHEDVKFFVIKSQDGVIRAAFDACDVCYPAKKGYSQDGDYMICNNCGMRFHSTRINIESGGCNPAPLAREVIGDQLVIRVADITPGTRFFGE